MDDLDRAEQQERQQRQFAIKAALNSGIETEQPDEENGIRYCLDCGMEIPQERLEARPESVRCVDCKQIKEQKDNR
jgi:DnaK suppressor protein